MRAIEVAEGSPSKDAARHFDGRTFSTDFAHRQRNRSGEVIRRHSKAAFPLLSAGRSERTSESGEAPVINGKHAADFSRF
jgi:hypothetical protein